MGREHFEAVLELLPVAVVLIEPGTGVVTFANSAADELLGGRFPRGTVEERMAGKVALSEGQELAYDALPSMRIARGESLRGVRLEWRLDGRTLHLLVSGDTVTDLEGRSVGVVVFEDLGAMYAAERMRDDSLALLDTIFESAPVGLALHGPDLRFVRVNRALADMNGLSPEEHVGRLGERAGAGAVGRHPGRGAAGDGHRRSAHRRGGARRDAGAPGRRAHVAVRLVPGPRRGRGPDRRRRARS